MRRPSHNASVPFRPYEGDADLATYMRHFGLGDLRVTLHGRKVRVEASTTHPAQLKLVTQLFSWNAKPIIYGFKNPGGYAWRVVYHLDGSFRFLMTDRTQVLGDLEDVRRFPHALGGFSDAESHIGLGNSSGIARARYLVGNRKKWILEGIKTALNNHGIHASMTSRVDIGGIQWELSVSGQAAKNLVNQLALRHQEKIVARSLIYILHGTKWAESGPVYRAFRASIKTARDICVEAARLNYLAIGKRKAMRKGRMLDLAKSVGTLRSNGKSIEAISVSTGMSERTVYRYLERLLDIYPTADQPKDAK